MDEAAVEAGRGRWSTAFALSLAVLLLPVFDALALILLPLALLILALPGNRRVHWIAIGVAFAVSGTLFVGGPLATVSRGWALMLGSIYLAMTLAQPHWDTTSRALSTVLIAMVAGTIGLSASGELVALDTMVQEQFRTVSAAFENLRVQMPDAEWVTEASETTGRISEVQAEVFPALLALQSLAALALASWTVRRTGRSEAEAFRLGRLRDFRFNDNLIWLLILGLLLVLSPASPLWTRIAANVLVFMGSLYALRGLAIFVYLAEGTKSIMTMIFGTLVLIFLYPVVVTGALLMGISDTWLYVRNRRTAPG